MKRSILFILVISTQFFSAQSADQGRINAYLGIGSGLYKTVGNGNVNNSGAALTTTNFLGFDYNVNKQISFGLELVNQNFLYEDSSRIDIVKSGMLGLNLKYHFLNKEKSSAYIGTSVGGFNFELFLVDSINNAQLLADGIYNTLYLGYNKYFGKVFGVYIQAGLINQPMGMGSLTVNGDAVDRWNRLDVADWRILMRGGFINFGLTFKFRNK